jgi:hypothetical protein
VCFQRTQDLALSQHKPGFMIGSADVAALLRYLLQRCVAGCGHPANPQTLNQTCGHHHKKNMMKRTKTQQHSRNDCFKTRHRPSGPQGSSSEKSDFSSFLTLFERANFFFRK